MFVSHVRHAAGPQAVEMEGGGVGGGLERVVPGCRRVAREGRHADCAHFGKSSLSQNKHLGSPPADLTSQMDVIF